MDELRTEMLKFLHKEFDEKRCSYYEATCLAMTCAAEIMSKSRVPFRKVYDVVKEAVQDFLFGEGA